MSDANNSAAEQLFDKALDIAEKHLEAAMKEAGPLSAYVSVAMIEVAVNQAVVDNKKAVVGNNEPAHDNQPPDSRAKKTNNLGPGVNPHSRFDPASSWTWLPFSMRGFRPPTPNLTLSL